MKSNLVKPTSPGRRGFSKQDFSGITAKKPQKSLLMPKVKTGGRNFQGRITVRHIGGGNKNLYRMIDFKRSNEAKMTIISIEYDPNRSARIALTEDEAGRKYYVIATEDMKPGMIIENGVKTAVAIGNCMELINIPSGILVSNVELNPGRGAVFARSAGLSVTIMGQEDNKTIIKLPSGELRRIDSRCKATIGKVSNTNHENIVWGKAGRKRWLGIRPTVRGKAMNPNTHPHGGGEGNTSIGMKYPKTPWGLPALGRRTRDKNKISQSLIIRRRK
jgi:large subunit ribosomal protein L2